MIGRNHDALDKHEFFHKVLKIWEREEKMLTLQVEMNKILCLLVHYKMYQILEANKD